MEKIYEYEEKFFCSNPEKIKTFLEKELQFSFIKKVLEEDIYFKDIKNKYLSKNTCLRLRKTNNKFLELTSKKANTFDLSIKLEKTFPLPLNKKDRLIHLLNRIGISEYITVFKERFIYQKKFNNIICHIMIDKINKKYTFLEIEFTSNKQDFTLSKKVLEKIIKELSSFKIEQTTENYRDFIKNKNS